MKAEEVIPALAALMFYQSKPKRKKGEEDAGPVSFETLEPEKQKPYLSLAEGVIFQIDQLNLRLVPKGPVKNHEEIEALLKSRIEATVRDFFNDIKVWKKGLIPQEELVARIYQIWSVL